MLLRAKKHRNPIERIAGGYPLDAARKGRGMREEKIAWANPYLKLTALAEMSGKSYEWIRRQMRSDDPPPHTRPGPGAHPLVLWSDYVEWFERKFGEGERIG